jgi:hypothetical protein
LRQKFVCIAILMIMLLIGLQAVVMAQNEFFYRLEAYVPLYNENLESVPDLAKRMFVNERINFHIADGAGEEIVGVATDAQGAILEMTSGGIDNPTIRAFIDSDVIRGLEADFSTERALAALREIRLEGVGFAKTIKVFFLNIARTLTGLFAGR